MNFRETVEFQIKAIKNRDIDALIKTLPAEGEETILILPNGNMNKSRDHFVEGHIKWFQKDSWDQNFEILNIIESAEMGIATLRYDYLNNGVKAFESLLSLVFKKVNDNWVLVHDQNTMIEAVEK